VSNLAFSPSFTRAMGYCRNAVYAWFAVAVLLINRSVPDHLLQPAVGASSALAVVCWLLLTAALQTPRRQWTLLGLHLIECLVLLMCARLWMLSAISLFSLSLVALAANTALWGWQRLAVFVPAAGLGLGIGELLSVSAQRIDPFWPDVWFGAGGTLCVLTICALSHSQVQQFVGLSRHLRNERRTLLRYLPSDLPAHLRHPRNRGMHRQWMTVVFIDLVDFTQASNELPPEALVDVLNRFMAQVHDHVENWGGTVSKFLGDGVLCVFPSDGSHCRGNAAAQAVRCVSLLPAVISNVAEEWRANGYGRTCAVRCGVASGYCCSGDWGGGGRLDYTVIGPPVNLAQRLQTAAAEYGGVLLDETTQRLANQASLQAAANTLSLKGLGPVSAYALPRTG